MHIFTKNIYCSKFKKLVKRKNFQVTLEILTRFKNVIKTAIIVYFLQRQKINKLNKQKRKLNIVIYLSKKGNQSLNKS